MEQLINLETASNILNVSKQTLRRWDESGKLAAIRSENGYRHYKYEDLLKNFPKDRPKPFVKWAGGKTQLLPDLLKYVPGSYKTYLEPFLGGGALFFALRPKKAILNDSNEELILTYKVIRDSVEELIFVLEEYKENHNKNFYYTTRSVNPSMLADVERAARFIYLNKTCFNGLYRVNKKGEFNVPMGSYKNPSILDSSNLKACSIALQGVTLTCMDYKDFLNEYSSKKDFVYLDPPYIPISKYSDFDRYSKEKFGLGHQVELSVVYNSLIEKGATSLLSNSSSFFVEKFYQKHLIEKVLASRFINKKGDSRGKIEEVLISNKQLLSQDKMFPSTRYMGSKNNLLPFIEKELKKLKVKTVFDAFSGSGVVSYFLKTKGYKVISNDFMRYSANITKALVENNNVTLNGDEVNALLKKNRKKSTFIADKFKGLYFSDEDNQFLDNTLTNIQNLSCDYKKSIALSALCRACLKRRPRGIFTYVGFRYDDGRKDLRHNLMEHFLFSLAEINQAVFSNKKNNISINMSILDIKDVNPDLIYLDPPYYSKHSDNDYVRRYHFVEGLSKNWEGLEIQEETKTKKFKKYESPFSTKQGTYDAFKSIIEQYKKSSFLISYSSNSLPTKEEIVEMLESVGKNVTLKEIDYRYSFGNHGHKIKEKNNNKVKEYLFLAE